MGFKDTKENDAFFCNYVKYVIFILFIGNFINKYSKISIKKIRIRRRYV